MAMKVKVHDVKCVLNRVQPNPNQHSTVLVVEQQRPATIRECGYLRRVTQNKSWDYSTIEEAVAKANKLKIGRVRIARVEKVLAVYRTPWVEKG